MAYRHRIHNTTTNVYNTIVNELPSLSNEFLLQYGNIEDLDVLTVEVDLAAAAAQATYEEHRKKQDEALAAAWDFITPYFDQPAFIQISDWKNSLASDHPVQAYIAAVEVWKAAIMFEYLMVKKPSLWADAPYDLDYSFVGSPPCKFTDLFLLVNTQLQPYAAGWSAPDIAGYAPGTRQNSKPILF